MNEDKKFKEDGYLKNGCGLIAEERTRQQQVLGYTDEGDDRYRREELREAAISHAVICDHRWSDDDVLKNHWPWDITCWRRGDRNKIKHLVKAGALIAAEIDRLYRKFQRDCNEITRRDFGFDAFDEMDAYELIRRDWAGVTPSDFVKKYFKEDYERTKIEQEEAERDEKDEAKFHQGKEGV